MTVPAATIAPHLLPTYVGVVMDGNRRWAKKAGFADPGRGHDVGADHVEDLLGWCAHWGIAPDRHARRPRLVTALHTVVTHVTYEVPQTSHQ